MIASRSMNIAAAVATVAAVSVAMARPAHGAGIASSDRPAALDIVTPGRDAAAGDALRHAPTGPAFGWPEDRLRAAKSRNPGSWLDRWVPAFAGTTIKV
jgi:hypothetical protein